jgi:hypothetical protein
LELLVLASDIAIVAHSAVEAQEVLNTSARESGITECDLEILRSKCTVLKVLCKKKLWAIRDHHITYESVKLPFIQRDDKIHCPGISINPWKRKPKFHAGVRLLSVA